MEKLSIVEKLNQDFYKNKLPYVSVHDKQNKQAREHYVIEEQRLVDMFYDDLLEDLEIVGNPKAGMLFAKAWELGHSAGLHEVYSHASDLVDLIK